MHPSLAVYQFSLANSYKNRQSSSFFIQNYLIDEQPLKIDSELHALLFLTHVPYLGSIKIQLLIKHFGSAHNAMQADPHQLNELPGFGPKIIQGWIDSKKQELWKKTLDIAHQQKIRIIPFDDSIYPKNLLDIVDYPLILYAKGSLKNREVQSLAVIGTRQASIYGLEMAGKLSGDLAAADFTIVSGLARGIDTAAHDAATERGRTIAVLGSGLGHLYPKENFLLAEKILEKNGAIISEFPIMTPPDRPNFPQRNRIVSGMTLGTLLIEAPKQSGAMITVDQALSYGRNVFALPGRVDQENFKGNHFLIKNQKAQLVENSEDILMCYNDLFTFSPSSPIMKKIPLEKEELEFFEHLPSQEVSIEDIVMKTKMPISKVNVLLMGLLLKKMIKEYPGKVYKKIL